MEWAFSYLNKSPKFRLNPTQIYRGIYFERWENFQFRNEGFFR